MENIIHSIKENVEKIALRVVTMEPDDIRELGAILKHLSSIQNGAETLQHSAVLTLCMGLRHYIEKLVLAEETDLAPLEDGVDVLQEICRCIVGGTPYESDISHILKKLKDEAVPGQASPQPFSATKEDIDTYKEFVLETLDNLENVEVNLIELEQSPQNSDTVHAIFRAFHTIKGVSGFLSLNKINRLAHATENLLDDVRENAFKINDAIIDVILEVVDSLKQMINSLELAIAAGDQNLEGDLDPGLLIGQLEKTARISKKENKRLGEVLIDSGVIDDNDLNAVLDTQKKTPGKKIGALLVDEKRAESKDVISALRIQKKGAPPVRFQVKVDTEKLDNLMDLTGELVISQSMLHQSSVLQSSADQLLHTNLNRLTQIVSSLQKTAMSMRMVPIRNTFHKLVRLVRDLSKHSGKDVELIMTGEETEIDRNVVEEIYEPLVHMIRNAIDHGIEPIEERKKIGKPLKGTIRLNAYQRGGHIIIELHDDGRGIDGTAIRRQAISRGLVGKDDDFSETELLSLIYHPGFSTAKNITDISGRGVGMDIVQNRIRKLRGRLALQSAPGKGCSVTISLPLTLAIIDGMVVRVEAERYIIPTLAITESFQPAVEDYHTVQGKGEMVKVRGTLIPLIRLDQVFGVARDQRKPWEGLVVVVENNGKKGGLLLDELLRQDEIVVKSLGDALKGVEGIAGGAILGDGKVGLILDVEQLLKMNGSASKRIVS